MIHYVRSNRNCEINQQHELIADAHVTKNHLHKFPHKRHNSTLCHLRAVNLCHFMRINIQTVCIIISACKLELRSSKVKLIKISSRKSKNFKIKSHTINKLKCSVFSLIASSSHQLWKTQKQLAFCLNFWYKFQVMYHMWYHPKLAQHIWRMVFFWYVVLCTQEPHPSAHIRHNINSIASAIISPNAGYVPTFSTED